MRNLPSVSQSACSGSESDAAGTPSLKKRRAHSLGAPSCAKLSLAKSKVISGKTCRHARIHCRVRWTLLHFGQASSVSPLLFELVGDGWPQGHGCARVFCLIRGARGLVLASVRWCGSRRRPSICDRRGPQLQSIGRSRKLLPLQAVRTRCLVSECDGFSQMCKWMFGGSSCYFVAPELPR